MTFPFDFATFVVAAAVVAGIGAFLVAYGIYALRRQEAVRRIGRVWAPVAGLNLLSSAADAAAPSR